MSAGLPAIVAELAAAMPARLPELMAKLAVARARHHFALSQFLLYSLHDRPRATWGDYRQHSPNHQRLLAAVNRTAPGGALLSGDKLRVAVRARAHEVPVAPTLIVAARRSRYPDVLSDARAVGDAAGLAAALADPAMPPALIVKPVKGHGGAGVRALTRDGSGWRLDGAARAPGELAPLLLEGAHRLGLLVQPRLANHPALAAAFGGTGLSTARVLVAATTDGPVVFSAAHKIIVGDALADNFHNGAAGNMLAGIDTAAGTIRRVFVRPRGRRFLMAPADHHPVTGAALAGLALPHWPATLDLARRASAAFPEYPLLGLDIAILADGPVLLETNTTWDASLPQVADAIGLAATLGPLLPRLALAPDALARARAVFARGNRP